MDKETRILDWSNVSSSDETYASVSEENIGFQVAKISSKPILNIGVTGTVKWYNVKRGYGFVCRHDYQEDVFFYQSEIVKGNPDHPRKSVADGEEILFDIVQGDKGNEAVNIRGIDGGCVKGSEYAKRYSRDKGSRRGASKRILSCECDSTGSKGFQINTLQRRPFTQSRSNRGRKFHIGDISGNRITDDDRNLREQSLGRGHVRTRGKGRSRGRKFNYSIFSNRSPQLLSNEMSTVCVYGVYRNIKKLDNQWKSNISGGEVIINLSNRIISSGIIGKLKCFNFERGYGFVCRDDTKEDIFIHQSAIDKCDKYHQQKLIKLGEEITFDIVDGDKSNEAANIYSIDEAQIMLCSPSISESGNLSIEDRVISSENISCTDNDNESLQSFLRSDIIQSDDEKKNVELEHRFFHKYDNLENTCMPQLSILTSTFNHQQRLDEELDAYMYG